MNEAQELVARLAQQRAVAATLAAEVQADTTRTAARPDPATAERRAATAACLREAAVESLRNAAHALAATLGAPSRRSSNSIDNTASPTPATTGISTTATPTASVPLLLSATAEARSVYEARERAYAAALATYVRAQFGAAPGLLEAASDSADAAEHSTEQRIGDEESGSGVGSLPAGLRGPDAAAYVRHRRELQRLRQADETVLAQAAHAQARLAAAKATLGHARRAYAAPLPSSAEAMRCVDVGDGFGE